MQLLLRPPRTSFPLFPARPIDAPTHIPHMYGLIRHPSSPYCSLSEDRNPSTHILISYNCSLNSFRALFGIRRKEGTVPHNVTMTQD